MRRPSSAIRPARSISQLLPRQRHQLAGRGRTNEAWAAGGSVAFETGRLFDLISGGMVLYDLPGLRAARHGRYRPLQPGQQQYGVAGQLYGRAHLIDDHEITAGRYLYDTPFSGRTTIACRPRPSMATR